MLDSLCLTNMNARVYNQALGRFTGADSIVPDPGYSRSYNRYSYVYNNPLGYTDPSGHEIETVVVTAESAHDIYRVGSIDNSSGGYDAVAGIAL